MNKSVKIFLGIATIVAAVWAAWGAAVYAGFIATFFCQRFYAIFPAVAVIGYLAETTFIIRPKKYLIFPALFSTVATCTLCVAGVVHDFVDPTEGEPGAWEWINGTSLSASAILAIAVVVQTVRFVKGKRKPNQVPVPVNTVRKFADPRR